MTVAEWPIEWCLFAFVACATGVWIAGTKVSIYAFEIANRTRIAKALMGLIFLAAATSLPEIVTTFTAALKTNANLVLTNLFGGIALQTAILAVADAFAVRAALTSMPARPIHVLESGLLILLISVLLGFSVTGEWLTVYHVGLGAFILAILYGAAIYVLRNFDDRSVWLPAEIHQIQIINKPMLTVDDLSEFSNTMLTAKTALACTAILIFGFLLVLLSETIAARTFLGTSFVGATLLAGSTSLPELSTTIAAVRLGAYTMALSNIFGSNLIMVLLLFPADVTYKPGALLDAIDKPGQFMLALGLAVTAIYLIGLVVRRKKTIFGMGLDSVAVIVVYFGGIAILFNLN